MIHYFPQYQNGRKIGDVTVTPYKNGIELGFESDQGTIHRALPVDEIIAFLQKGAQHHV